MKVSTGTAWDPARSLLRTELRGRVSVGDVADWREGLEREESKLPQGGGFRLLLDLRGFEPAELEAHKAMRLVVPELLLRHGMRPAFTDLFDDAPEPEVRLERGVRCTAFANVHHDAAKMARYESLIATPEQRFFTDIAEAERWLASVGRPA